MEKETITIRIQAHSNDLTYDDKRTFSIETTRGDAAKYLDEITQEVEARFEQ